MPVNSHDVTDEQWEGLAQVVPLRGRDAWPSAVGHRALPEAPTEARRRFVVLRVNVFADATVRYPEVTLAAAVARAPDLVLLPSEPYEFEARHVPEVRDAIAGAHVRLVDGRDLFWWGIRTPAAAARLAGLG